MSADVVVVTKADQLALRSSPVKVSEVISALSFALDLGASAQDRGVIQASFARDINQPIKVDLLVGQSRVIVFDQPYETAKSSDDKTIPLPGLNGLLSSATSTSIDGEGNFASSSRFLAELACRSATCLGSDVAWLIPWILEMDPDLSLVSGCSFEGP